jgi:hypothetical protein
MVCDDNYEKQIGIKIHKVCEVHVDGKNALDMFVLAYAPILSVLMLCIEVGMSKTW